MYLQLKIFTHQASVLEWLRREYQRVRLFLSKGRFLWWFDRVLLRFPLFPPFVLKSNFSCLVVFFMNYVPCISSHRDRFSSSVSLSAFSRSMAMPFQYSSPASSPHSCSSIDSVACTCLSFRFCFALSTVGIDTNCIIKLSLMIVIQDP